MFALVARPAGPPKLGLLAAAPTIIENDPHWGQENAWRPEGCRNGGVTDPCLDATKPDPDRRESLVANPFVVETGDECSALGGDPADLRARARRSLGANESRLIAAEFEIGTQNTASGWGDFRLSNAAVTVIGAAGMTATNALACLEDFAAANGSGEAPFIHVTRKVATLLVAASLLYRVGNTLLTHLDSVVVPDAGYTGVGPTGADVVAGTSFAYVTPPVAVHLSPVVVNPPIDSEGLDRAVNTWRFRAERMASIEHSNCFAGAVRVTVAAC